MSQITCTDAHTCTGVGLWVYKGSNKTSGISCERESRPPHPVFSSLAESFQRPCYIVVKAANAALPAARVAGAALEGACYKYLGKANETCNGDPWNMQTWASVLGFADRNTPKSAPPSLLGVRSDLAYSWTTRPAMAPRRRDSDDVLLNNWPPPRAPSTGRSENSSVDVAADPAVRKTIAPIITTIRIPSTMSKTTLAPRTNIPGSNDVPTSDPFATPDVSPLVLPAIPDPTAQLSSKSRTLPIHTRESHEQTTHPYKSASMSSAAASSNMTPISSIDLEKTAAAERETQSRRSSRRISRDPEKAAHSPASNPTHASRVPYIEDADAEEIREVQETNALRILLFLSGPCVVLSFLNTVWTIISLLLTTMTQPVRLCARRPTFGQQLGGLVGPALNLQLKSIYTPLRPHADEDTTYRAGMLVTVMLLSPFLSMGMMMAAWIAAVYWVSSAVVGDPAGQDKRDDGRETVLALRNWWERWLVRSVSED